MKKIFLLYIFCISAKAIIAQKEAFDIVSFMPPQDKTGKVWKKESTDNILAYTYINTQNNTWCRINIVKSTVSLGSIDKDFESEWNQLIVKNYSPTEDVQVDSVREFEGWKFKAGVVKFMFNKKDALAILTTISGFNRCMSIVSTTNSPDYTNVIEGLLASVELQKKNRVEQNSLNQTESKGQINSSADDLSKFITGTWSKSGSMYETYGDPTSHGNAGYTKSQYSFNENGTYNFISKIFRYSHEYVLLVRENGSYQISGNNLSINPEKSSIEEWTKKDGTDKYGKLVSTQNRKPEIITYVINRHYFTGIQQWNLVLQADKPTLRDGPFSNNTTFTNAWYYVPISANNPLIDLPSNK